MLDSGSLIQLIVHGTSLTVPWDFMLVPSILVQSGCATILCLLQAATGRCCRNGLTSQHTPSATLPPLLPLRCSSQAGPGWKQGERTPRNFQHPGRDTWVQAPGGPSARRATDGIEPERVHDSAGARMRGGGRVPLPSSSPSLPGRTSSSRLSRLVEHLKSRVGRAREKAGFVPARLPELHELSLAQISVFYETRPPSNRRMSNLFSQLSKQHSTLSWCEFGYLRRPGCTAVR
jgi:hypothetical protein